MNKKEYDKRYREKNKDKIRERKKKYYQANKEKFKKQRAEYYEKNKEEIRSKRAEYERQRRVKRRAFTPPPTPTIHFKQPDYEKLKKELLATIRKGRAKNNCKEVKKK